jgi:hypothetical protein
LGNLLVIYAEKAKRTNKINRPALLQVNYTIATISKIIMNGLLTKRREISIYLCYKELYNGISCYSNGNNCWWQISALSLQKNEMVRDPGSELLSNVRLQTRVIVLMIVIVVKKYIE